MKKDVKAKIGEQFKSLELERVAPWRCPRWTTPNGTCSDDDSGAGRHTCGVTSQTHAKCRCACGVENLRDAGEREAAKHEARQRQVSIDVAPNGQGRVVVGGVDIANMVSSATVELRGMQATQVTLGMEYVRVVVEGEGVLDDETATALRGLGWAPPEHVSRLEQGDRARRMALQDEMGGLGNELREWDGLISLVGQLYRHNAELAKDVTEMSAILDEVPVSMGGRNEG